VGGSQGTGAPGGVRGGASSPPNGTGTQPKKTHADLGGTPFTMDWENLLALCCSILLAGYLVYSLVHPERL
jgi:hypothetical protein